VFEAMEKVIFLRTGVRPRSWDETDAAWREDTGEAIAATAGNDSS
jgi:ubiquitin-conjugating enzyme E2 variant